MLHTAAYSERVARLRKAQVLQEQRLSSPGQQPALQQTQNVPRPARLPVARPRMTAPHPPQQQVPHAQSLNQPAVVSFTVPKLALLVHDAQLQIIECTGPDKPLILTKQGRAQVSNIMLSTEEITQTLQDISQQTRIPLVQGLFKALIGPFTITGVYSEVAGSRFILQRSIHG